MDYETALQIVKKAAGHLERGEGNMDTATIVMHVAALDLATKVIAKRNGVVLP